MKTSKSNKKRILVGSLVAVAVILITAAVVIAFVPFQFPTFRKEVAKEQEQVEIVTIHKPANQDTTKDQAVEATVEQFKRLGENVSESDLKFDTITKDGKQYYYIKSAQNSIMIDVKAGKIVRINSVSL